MAAEIVGSRSSAGLRPLFHQKPVRIHLVEIDEENPLERGGRALQLSRSITSMPLRDGRQVADRVGRRSQR